MYIFLHVYFHCFEVRDEDLVFEPRDEDLDFEPLGDLDPDELFEFKELLDFKESTDLQKLAPYERIAKCVDILLQPLYPGTEKTVMSVVFCLLRWAKEDTRTTLANCKMKKLFQLVQTFMPTDNNLPTFVRAHELVNGCCGVRVRVLDSCVQGCVLCRNETSGPKRNLEQAEKCPECQRPRFHPVTKRPYSRTTILGAKGQVVARLFWAEYRKEASPPPCA